MTTHEIAIVTEEELLSTAELLTSKLRALELSGLDDKEFASGVTCLEAAALGYIGAFTPKALESLGVSNANEVPAEMFQKVMDFFLSVQNGLVARGIDVRRVLSKDLVLEAVSAASSTERDEVLEVWEAFPSLEWELDLHSSDAFTMRSGPLAIDYDNSLTLHPFGVELEFPGIQMVDFRASSAAEARSTMMGLRDGLTGLLGPDPFAL